MYMLYHAISKTCVCFLLLGLMPSYGFTCGMSMRKVGILVGTMSFVSGSRRTSRSLGEASNVTVELVHKGRIILLVANDNGDYVEKLPSGNYCLKSARSPDNKPLRFSPYQHICFQISRNKDTRFDVMLLKP
jgi:hypothetical protein